MVSIGMQRHRGGANSDSLVLAGGLSARRKRTCRLCIDECKKEFASAMGHENVIVDCIKVLFEI